MVSRYSLGYLDVFGAIYSCERVVSVDALLGIGFEGECGNARLGGYSVGRFLEGGRGVGLL